MRLLDPRGWHESGNVVREKLSGIDAFRFVRFTCPSEVERDAGKVLGVLCHLEGVTGVIGGQIRNENEGLSGSLLVIVHRDVVGFDLRHGSLSFRMCSVSPYAPVMASRWKVSCRPLLATLAAVVTQDTQDTAPYTRHSIILASERLSKVRASSGSPYMRLPSEGN